MIDVEKPSAPLRVVNWNMQERVGAKTHDGVKLSKPSWRTSFGSERRSAVNVAPAGVEIEADLVLIQGLFSVREARQTFPARTWRLVVSRQMLENDDPLNPWANDAFAERPATAIAVRYQPPLRVTAQEHLLDLAALDGSHNATETAAAGTAVRLSWGNKTFWAISVDLTSGCVKAAQACGALQRLEAWRAEKLQASETVITGGQWDAPLSEFLPPPPCDGRSLAFTTSSNSGAEALARRWPDARFGCFLQAQMRY
jgi:hypothetical protein